MSIEGPLGAFADAVLYKMLEVEQAEAGYTRAIGGRVEELVGARCAVHKQLPHPAFNTAFTLDAEGQQPQAFVQQVERLYAREGLPYQFSVTPMSQPPGLGALLAEQGYVVASRRSWMELMVAPPSAPPDPRIQVGPAEDAGVWARTVAQGIESPAADALLLPLAAATARCPTHRLLLARYAGVEAGGCEVSVDEGIAVVRHLAVRRPFREREVARALLHAACEAAYRLDGFRVVIRVFHGSGAEDLFESFGFGGMQLSEDYVRTYPAFLLD